MHAFIQVEEAVISLLTYLLTYLLAYLRRDGRVERPSDGQIDSQKVHSRPVLVHWYGSLHITSISISISTASYHYL